MKALKTALITTFIALMTLITAPVLVMAMSMLAVIFGIGGDWAIDTFVWCGEHSFIGWLVNFGRN